MISQEVEGGLNAAFDQAQMQRHAFVTVEHLLLALLDSPSVQRVLRTCSANAAGLRAALADFTKANTPRVAHHDCSLTHSTGNKKCPPPKPP